MDDKLVLDLQRLANWQDAALRPKNRRIKELETDLTAALERADYLESVWKAWESRCLASEAERDAALEREAAWTKEREGWVEEAFNLRARVRTRRDERDAALERAEKAEADRDHWCREMLRETIRADKAESQHAAALERERVLREAVDMALDYHRLSCQDYYAKYGNEGYDDPFADPHWVAVVVTALSSPTPTPDPRDTRIAELEKAVKHGALWLGLAKSAYKDQITPDDHENLQKVIDNLNAVLTTPREER